MNWFGSIFTDLSVLPLLLFPIKPMSPEQTLVGVCLMISSAIWAFEWVRAWFLFFRFQSWRVDLVVYLVTPSKFPMVFRFMRTVAFDTFWSLASAWECCVTPLPTIFALQYARVHVGFPNGCNITSNVETSVNEHLGITATLDVPDIYPNNWHVRFRRNLYYSWFRSKRNIIKDMILLEDHFNVIRSKPFLRILMRVEWDTNNL